MNKFLKIKVSNADSVLYQNDMASPQSVMATLELFANVGNTITLEVCQLETKQPTK